MGLWGSPNGFIGFRVSEFSLGFRVVISGVTSPLVWPKSIVTLLITPLITTLEPPSRP